jgi:hypothetical protein
MHKFWRRNGMRIIKGYLDLELLRENATLPNEFLDYLEAEWMEFYDAYSDGEPLEEFSLELHGMQFVLESGDSLSESIGETVLPEYVERISLGEVDIYRMYVMEAEVKKKLYKRLNEQTNLYSFKTQFFKSNYMRRPIGRLFILKIK